MAKKSVIARQNKIRRTVARYAEKYERLKKEKDYEGLDKLPKNAHRIRLKRYCWRCGRFRSVMAPYGLCRICINEKVGLKEIPGIRKVSS